MAKSIFAPNSLDQPLILMACKSHNLEKKIDDEYASLLLQATSDTPESYESFTRSVDNVGKAIKKDGPIEARGTGLVMGMKKNARPLPFIKINGILREFGGAKLDIDTKRFNNFYANIAKGLLVLSTEKIYNWDNYEIKVMFDHLNFTNRPGPLKKVLDYVLENAQYAERWEKVLFAAGVTLESPSKKLGSLQAVETFSSHVAIVSIMEK